MDILISPEAWLGALLIFFLRVCDMTLDTLRLLFVVRGRKGIAWILGFFQSVIFVIAITSVISNLDNFLTVIGYAAGFATGNVIGMIIEERLAVGHTHLRVISSNRGVAIALRLRQAGYAVTEIPARGKDGGVSLLHCDVLRKHAYDVRSLIKDVDADAFITADDIRPIWRGFWRSVD